MLQHSRQLPTAVVWSVAVLSDSRSKFVVRSIPFVSDARTHLSRTPVSVSVRTGVGGKLYCNTYRMSDSLAPPMYTSLRVVKARWRRAGGHLSTGSSLHAAAVPYATACKTGCHSLVHYLWLSSKTGKNRSFACHLLFPAAAGPSNPTAHAQPLEPPPLSMGRWSTLCA